MIIRLHWNSRSLLLSFLLNIISNAAHEQQHEPQLVDSQSTALSSRRAGVYQINPAKTKAQRFGGQTKTSIQQD